MKRETLILPPKFVQGGARTRRSGGPSEDGGAKGVIIFGTSNVVFVKRAKVSFAQSDVNVDARFLTLTPPLRHPPFNKISSTTVFTCVKTCHAAKSY